MDIRVGHGFDVHKFSEDRKLILCGVEIPHDKGLLGHSDADVATHALMDALLGAAALGDIGKHFPDTDEKYKGISSMKLLSYVKELIETNNCRIENIDSQIVCQKPKLLPYMEKMRLNIAETLGINVNKVSVKATTEEKMGFTGNGEGIKAYAVCLIENL